MMLFRILLSLGALSLLACTNSGESNYKLLVPKNIHCPDGAKLEYQPWGQSGMIAICKIDHGPFVAAENGHIVLEGENYMGEPSGIWKWLDSSGKVQKTEHQ